MKRRQFIRNMSAGSAAGLTLGGIPLNLLAANSRLNQVAAASTNDNVLIFIQLHGGNDGLNTLIPISQYTDYFFHRPNIAIGETGTGSYIDVDPKVDDIKRVGLHPEMLSFSQMYNEGKVAIIQNVGYPEMNLSHFRGRDVVFMGTDEQEGHDYRSGWMGRYLDNIYPGYPDDYPDASMPDPLGIELSGSLSLAFHREKGIPIGLNIGNPQDFYDLIDGVGVKPPIKFPNSHAGEELKYIMDFEKKTNDYAERLKDVFKDGRNSSVDYREEFPYSSPAKYNGLANQLKLIARLLSGGIKTKIFLCRIGGFDTHGEQVEKDATYKGTHASLLYNMSTAVQDFYTDLHNLGIDNRVLSITFTEFGRRVKSNVSYGTDHGTATPVFVFGTSLISEIHGVNPLLGEDDLQNGNMVYDIDYRRIYTSIIQDWFGGDNEALVRTGFADWVDQKLEIISTTGNSTRTSGKADNSLLIYPNPVKDLARVQFNLSRRGEAAIYVIDGSGRKLKTIRHEGWYGSNNLSLDVSDLPEGMYQLLMVQRDNRISTKFLKL